MSETQDAASTEQVRDLPWVIQHVAPRMRTIHFISFFAAVVLAAVALNTMSHLLETQSDVTQLNKDYQDCQDAVTELQETSDYLTEQSRAYVRTGARMHLDNYVTEIEETDRRGKALSVLQQQATSEDAVEALTAARTISDQLATTELYALRLAAVDLADDELPASLTKVKLLQADAAMPTAERRAKAQDMLTSNTYASRKLSIRNKVHVCSDLLVKTLQTDLEQTDEQRLALLTNMQISVIGLVVVAGLVIASNSFLLLEPIASYEKRIRNDLPLQPAGARELRYLTSAYNEMYEINLARAETLRLEAHNDALTGALNRGAFDNLLTIHKHDSALILVDVDYFKNFNDEWGHDMGDAILIEVAATLCSSFRATDHICRIGGDEFAVIMTAVTPLVRDIIAHKIRKVQSFLADESNGLPACSVSVGVAFGNENTTDDGLFQAADRALYQVKEAGRNGYAFAEE